MPRRLRPGPADVAATASVGGLVAVAAVMGRNLWFFSDDWNILADYHDGYLLEPFNGHLSAVPAGIYQVLFHTVGLGSYWPYRSVGLMGMGLLGVLSYRFARPRVGPWPAVLAATAIVWGSGGVTNVMFPFLVNFSLPLALLVGAWLLMDRDTVRSDVGASACLAVALATSGLGVLAMAAIGVELVWSRAALRRWLAFAPPVALWAVWYLGHRIDAPGDHGFGAVVSYALRMLWGGCTALAAGWRPGGVLVAMAVVALLATAALRWRTLDARALGALSAPLLFAGLTAYSRLHVVPAIPPDELRYRWTIAAGIVMAVVCLWSRDRPASPAGSWTPAQWTACAVAAILVVVGAGVLVGDLRVWADTVETAAPGLRAELFAAEASAGSTPDDHVLPLSYVPVTQGGYLDAIADVGSPLGSDAGAFGGTEDHRISADTLLAASAPADRSPDTTTCTSLTPGAGVRPGDVVVVETADPDHEVRLARFSTDGVPVDTVEVADGRALTVPGDAPGTPGGAPPYRVLTSPPAGLQVCR